MRTIRIDDVIVARSDVDAVEPLPDGLALKLYSDPIIVRDDMVLIDGLKRILRHKAQGHETVRATVVSTFMEAMGALTPLHANRPNDLTPLRIWNFYSVLLDYSRTFTREARTGFGWREGPDGSKVRVDTRSERIHGESRVRINYITALNVSGHQIQSSAYMYRLVEAGDPLAQRLVERVERGEFGIAFANRLYRRPHNLGGNVTNRAEQQRILERGATELAAQINALQKLGYPLLVSDEELAEAIQGLASTRSQLTTMVSGLRKALKERENNG